MDGVKWMELVDAGVLKLPPRTILSVTSRSKSGIEKTVYFGRKDFAHALSYFGNMAGQDVMAEVYVTAHRMRRAIDLTELNLLNRCNFALDSVTFLNYWHLEESDEG